VARHSGRAPPRTCLALVRPFCVRPHASQGGRAGAVSARAGKLHVPSEVQHGCLSGHRAPSSLCTGVCAAARAGRVDADGRGPGRARTLHDPGRRQVVPAVALGGAATHGLCVRRHRDPQKGRLPGLFQRSTLVGPCKRTLKTLQALMAGRPLRSCHTQGPYATAAPHCGSQCGQHSAAPALARERPHPHGAVPGLAAQAPHHVAGDGGARHAPTGCCSPWTLAASCSATATGVKLGQGSVGVAAHPRAAARRGCWRPATLRRPAAAPRRSRPGS